MRFLVVAAFLSCHLHQAGVEPNPRTFTTLKAQVWAYQVNWSAGRSALQLRVHEASVSAAPEDYETVA